MATINYYLSPISLLIQIFNNVGVPLQGGFVYTYVAGTTTPVTTYTDSTGTTPNQNPIALSSAGRLQSVGGAPVAVWVPANTAHKLVITDSSGNFILSLDNLTGLNDPSTLLTLLSTVSTSATLGGSDLVANAMRSYDVVASVRAAQAPSLASGQTLVIDIEGGTLVNDGNGGIFYWSPTSTATDDGVTVIKPTATLSANPGRYLRQSNLYGTAGTFTMTVTGCTTAPTVNCSYVKNGNLISLSIGDTGLLTSNSTGFGFSGFPGSTLGGITQVATTGLIPAEDNTVLGAATYLTIPLQTGTGNIVASLNNASGAWTSSGTKRILASTSTYIAQ